MREDFEPFENAEEVWFWFCTSASARSGGLRSKSDYWGKPRCCELPDIQRIIKQMKRNHHLDNRQLRVMVKWGLLQVPPYYERSAKRSEIRLWETAMLNFEFYLKQRRIL